ncbi:hypothetical protein BKA93DRAFT_882818 [Sparassis latifolia]
MHHMSGCAAVSDRRYIRAAAVHSGHREPVHPLASAVCKGRDDQSGVAASGDSPAVCLANVRAGGGGRSRIWANGRRAVHVLNTADAYSKADADAAHQVATYTLGWGVGISGDTRDPRTAGARHRTFQIGSIGRTARVPKSEPALGTGPEDDSIMPTRVGLYVRQTARHASSTRSEHRADSALADAPIARGLKPLLTAPICAHPSRARAAATHGVLRLREDRARATEPWYTSRLGPTFLSVEPTWREWRGGEKGGAKEAGKGRRGEHRMTVAFGRRAALAGRGTQEGTDTADAEESGSAGCTGGSVTLELEQE